MQRLGLENIQDLDMLITDLPELEDTDFYRLMKEKWLSKGVEEGEMKGAIKTILRFGRQYLGPEPGDIPNVLRTLTVDDLDALIDQMPKLSSWDDFRKLIPAKQGSR